MSAPDELLVLGRQELVGLGITWVDVVDVLDDAFAQKARGLVQNPPKPRWRRRSRSSATVPPTAIPDLHCCGQHGCEWEEVHERFG